MGTVVVVGGGNAGLSAAIAAHQAGAEVIVLDRGPADGSGSDSSTRAGCSASPITASPSWRPFTGPLGMEASTGIDRYSSYSEGDFLGRLGTCHRVPARCRPREEIVNDSYQDIQWLAEQGVPFLSGIIVDANGKARHSRPGWHGGFVEVSGAGQGLMRGLLNSVAKYGFKRHNDTEVLEIEPPNGSRSFKVHARDGDGERRLYEADSVVLGCRRLSGGCGVADALSRPGLGSRQGACVAVQHRRAG